MDKQTTLDNKAVGYDILCPYCGNSAKFMTSKEFYGRDYGTNLYVCRPCDARIGTHERTANALGTLAKAELRELRRVAHSLFDPLWRGVKGKGDTSRVSRKEAYKWLYETMGVSKEDGHIAKFDEEQCRQLIAVLKN